MKKELKYSHIFYVTFAILVINLIFVIIFLPKIKTTVYSIFPTGMALTVIANGILACIFKHKGNFLLFAIRKKYRIFIIFSSDQEYTFTEEYERDFRASLLVYCAAIPFYLPIILFVSELNTLWLTMLAFSVPQIFITAQIFYRRAKKSKAEKLRQEALEKERIEQEKREELGYWK